LNGGPACSSMDGLWIENGPFRLQPGNNENGSGDWKNIEFDAYSWHKAPAYTLYIDQPVGTGLAFTTSGHYPSTDELVNIDFYYFLTEFMKLHSDKFLDNASGNGGNTQNGVITPTLRRPLYFSGESHAGHYIPSMMNYIRKQNMKITTTTTQEQQNGGNGAPTDSVLMPLSGALIGNGWFDPIYQYSAHEAAYGHGIIGKGQERSLALKEEKCRVQLRKGKYVSSICFDLLDEVVTNSLGSKTSGALYKVSQYDYRKWELIHGNRDFPPGHKDVEAYLGQTSKIKNAPVQDVLKAIHATPSWTAGQRYRECTDPPYNALKHQDGLGVTQDIIELLNHEPEEDGGQQHKIELLFFNGIQDLICNHVGNENALENLQWKHITEYQTSTRYGWKSQSLDKLGGYMKGYNNLSFLKILNSGHMVPMDVPDVALDMLQTFIYKQSFETYNQNINVVAATGATGSGGGGSSSNTPCPQCPQQEKCPDNTNDNTVACPVCEDEDGDPEFCTKRDCESKYDFSSSTSTSISTLPTSMSSSPIVTGVVIGVAILSTLLGMGCLVYYCLCRRRNNGNSTKYGSVNVELSNSSSMNGRGKTNGYSDDDSDNEDDDIEIDEEYDSGIRQRAQLA